MGTAVAFHAEGSVELPILLLGLLGLVLAFAGVEIFNEAFDPADSVSVLQPDDSTRRRPRWWWGVACFGAAFHVALYLTLLKGPWIMAIAFSGFVIAYLYVGPPIRLVYRGLGELSIFLAYGPLLVLGSYYLQTSRLDWTPLLTSLVPGTLILSLAILNEIPDYYQDMLVGKRNIVARLGRRKGANVYAGAILLSYNIPAFLALASLFPLQSLSILSTLPMALWSIKRLARDHDEPAKLLPVVNLTAILYLVNNSLLALSYI
mgnify:CR=1 FL=1